MDGLAVLAGYLHAPDHCRPEDCVEALFSFRDGFTVFPDAHRCRWKVDEALSFEDLEARAGRQR